MCIHARIWACLVGAAMVLGCRSASPHGELRSVLSATTEREVEDSFVFGHAFGDWLVVTPDFEALNTLEEACVLEQGGDQEEAIELLGDAIERRPALPSLLLARGALYFASHYPRAASGDFQKAAKLDPGDPSTHYALGVAYQALALSGQALQSFLRAGELGLDTADYHLELARTYRSLRRLGLAAREYSLSLRDLQDPPMEQLVESALLVSEDQDKAATVQGLARVLQTGEGHSESRDFVRVLFQESNGVPVETVCGFLRALDVDHTELEHVTERMLLAVQLTDLETRDAKTEEVLGAEPDPQRRAAIERYLEKTRG